MVENNLGDALRIERKRRGLTQGDVATLLEISTDYVSKIEPPFPYEQFLISKERAIKGYEKRLRTDPNNAKIYYRLSDLLDPGVGLEKTEPRSRQYLEKAAAMGHIEAIELLEFIRSTQ